jgi:hypothetical protein
VRYVAIVPFDPAQRIAGEDHATLWAKTIALGARNGVEYLHAAGAFTDEQALALKCRLRSDAYEVLTALRRMDSRRADDPFSAYLIELTGDCRGDPLCAALRSAITNAVREFADAERIDAETAARLEHAAIDGAFEVVELYYRLDQPDGRRQLAFLINSIPSYWEQPPVSPAFGAMLEDRSAPPRPGRAR